MDYENCEVPRDYEIATLKSNIQAALQTSDPQFEIHETIYAVGPNYGRTYQKLISWPKEFEVFTIPKIYMGCDSDTDCDKFVVNGDYTDPMGKILFSRLDLCSLD